MTAFRFIAVFFLVGSLACNSNEKPPSTGLTTDSDILKVKLSTLDGSPVNVNEYLGKTIFIHFWATWCKPCLQEMPSIAKAQEILAKEKVIFLLASEETTEEIGQFKNDHDYNFRYVRVENVPELNVMGLPTTFIYNKDGKLVFSELGSRKWDDLQNLDIILKAKSIQ